LAALRELAVEATRLDVSDERLANLAAASRSKSWTPPRRRCNPATPMWPEAIDAVNNRTSGSKIMETATAGPQAAEDALLAGW